MKIVINSKHGGFGLSDKAFELLLTKKGIKFEVEEDTGIFGNEYYQYGHLGNDDYYISQYKLTENRADTDLIEVIEELQGEANDRFSDLKIVEIPDNVKWTIEEYDGKEWVAEKHRTWG